MNIAYIFEDVGGWYFCDAESDYLDTKGNCYKNKTAAIRAASSCEYTHYQCGETIKKISKRDHDMNWATG